MWLKKINSHGDEFRYELETFYTAPLLLADGGQICCFVIYKYFKNNNGEFLLCKSNEKVYITIETLLSQFVAIDSNIDKELTALQNFKKTIDSKNLEANLAPFCLNKVEEINSEHDDEKTMDGHKVTNMDDYGKY